MVRRAETGRVVMLSVTARRLISLPLSCLVTALVSSSGFDVLWEIIGAETNVSRHLFVLSSEHKHAATEYLRICTKNTPRDAPKSFYDQPHCLKSVNTARGSIT